MTAGIAGPNEVVAHQVVGHTSLTVFGLQTDDQANLAVSRLAGCPEGPAVVLLHGSFANRGFWLASDGTGFARFLSDHGYDVWIPELRGHGQSPKGAGYARTTADNFIQRDLPAIVTFLTSQGIHSAAWVGHSFGGLYLAAALSVGAIEHASVDAIVMVGSQWSDGQRYLRWPLFGALAEKLANRLGRFPAPALGMGPEPAPGPALAQAIRWKRLQRWLDRSGHDYASGLSAVHIPCLGIASKGDRTDPLEGCRCFLGQLGAEDRTFLPLGKAHGHRQDYSHSGMIASRDARQEVWPAIEEWLHLRVGAARKAL